MSRRTILPDRWRRKLDEERFGAGAHPVPMTAGLASGTGIVALNVDERTYTRTLTVVR